jgi:hypothetical protein
VTTKRDDVEGMRRAFDPGRAAISKWRKSRWKPTPTTYTAGEMNGDLCNVVETLHEIARSGEVEPDVADKLIDAVNELQSVRRRIAT